MATLRSLFVDPVLEPPEEYLLEDTQWIVSRNYCAALNLIQTEKFHIVSITYDLGFSMHGERTGYNLLKSMVDLYKKDATYKPRYVRVHTLGNKLEMLLLIRNNWQ